MSNLNDDILSLIKDTNFEVSSTSKVLNTREKVRTPIEALNCLLGGGIPLGSVIHTFGLPQAGKSTWLYQCAGIFQQQYPNGIVAIVDMESSADPSRLLALGVDPSKVIRLPATSVESGFLALFKMLENKTNNEKLKDVPVFVIWDTISKGLAQDGSTQSRMNAMDRARVIKNYMNEMFSQIEKHKFILALLNQVVWKTDKYGNTKMDSGGGVALKHDNHLSCRMDWVSDTTDGPFITKRWSAMTITKSKISPEVANMSYVMDVSLGGKINEVESYIWFAVNTLQLIDYAKGWYKFNTSADANHNKLIGRLLYDYNKSYKYSTLLEVCEAENSVVYDIFRYLYMELLSDKFKLQADIIKDYKDEVYNRIAKNSGYYFGNFVVMSDEEKLSLFDTFSKDAIAAIMDDNNSGKVVCVECGAISDSFEYKCSNAHTSNVEVDYTKSELIRLNYVAVDTEDSEEVVDSEVSTDE